MTASIKNLVPAKYVEAVETPQYTADLCKAIFDKPTVTNISAVNVSFTLHLVAPSGTAGASNTLIDARTIAPHECYTCPELAGKTIENGYSISTMASAASSLVIDIGGREIR